jgi:hypothetical protein
MNSDDDEEKGTDEQWRGHEVGGVGGSGSSSSGSGSSSSGSSSCAQCRSPTLKKAHDRSDPSCKHFKNGSSSGTNKGTQELSMSTQYPCVPGVTLVIGNTYQGTNRPLPSGAKNKEVMVDLFAGLGFEVHAYDDLKSNDLLKAAGKAAKCPMMFSQKAVYLAFISAVTAIWWGRECN